MNLTSPKWCDLVFEGRNKDYGAYPLRMDSGRRHMVALAIVAGVVIGLTTLFFAFFFIDFSPKVKVTQVRDISQLKPAENKKRVKPQGQPQQQKREGNKKAPQETIPLIASDELVAEAEPTKADGGGEGGTALVNYADSTALDSAATLHNAVNANVDKKDFKKIAQLPEYPGGMVAFMKWLTANLKYPQTGRNNDGKVVVQFIVMTDGTISDLKIIHSHNQQCDNEVLRVLRMMPKWKPGTENGKPILTQMVLPINFKS